MKKNRPYDLAYLFRCLVTLMVVIGAMYVSNGVGFAIIIPFVFWSMLKRDSCGLFFWILLMVCMLLGNPAIVRKGLLFGLLQRGMIVFIGMVMLLQMIGLRSSTLMSHMLWIMLYIAYMVIPSSTGWAPKVSFLKIFLFVMVYMAYYGAANKIAQSSSIDIRKLRSITLSVAIFFVFGSIALLPFPTIGQLHGEELLDLDPTELVSLFKGMTSHSQALGPVASSIGVILLADMLFSIKRPDPLYMALLLCCPFLIFKTSSRTGMGAFLLGTAFIIFFFIKPRGVMRAWKTKVINALALLFTVGIIAIFFTPGFSDRVQRFALKMAHDDKQIKLTTENMFASRQGKIDECMKNFKKKPMLGNGFQVSVDMMYSMKAQKGLVLSAPIEKGVWIFAVLEEGGIVGMILFSGFLLFAIATMIRKKLYSGAACLFLATLTNIGEFTFFSMTYIGGYIWAMVFVGIAIDAQRLHADKKVTMTSIREQMRSRESAR